MTMTARAALSGYSCPVELTLDVVAGKWRPAILWELRNGPKRFGALLTVLTGISHKVLTSQLRRLERMQLIRRSSRPGGRRHVEYEMTEFGITLRPVLAVMAGWAKQHHRRLEQVGL